MNQYPENWPEISHAAKVRAAFTCRDCGAVKNPWNTLLLHTHHIDFDKANCDESNLRVLCRPCHYETHLKNDPLFYFGEDPEDYNRYGLPKPVPIGDVIKDILPKYLSIQRRILIEVKP